MGRPINNRYFGATTTTGNQIAVSSCWIPGEVSSNTTSIIMKQVSAFGYLVQNTSTSASGIVYLRQSVAVAGDAVINVSPLGSGFGATVAARLGLATVTVTAGGTGYTVGDVLTISGGTSTIAGTVTVSTVSTGVITAVSVTTPGVYSVLPAGARSVTGGTGTGATITINTWKLTGLVATAGGQNYGSPTVAFSGGAGTGGTGTLTVTNGVITAGTITAAGSGYTSIPTATITTGVTLEHAQMIRSARVQTFEGNTYFWKQDMSVADSTFAALPFA